MRWKTLGITVCLACDLHLKDGDCGRRSLSRSAYLEYDVYERGRGRKTRGFLEGCNKREPSSIYKGGSKPSSTESFEKVM